MDTQDPNLILASTASRYEPPEVAQARQLAIQKEQQGLSLGAQDLQAKQYANQETATQLQEQQVMLDAMRKQAAGGTPGPAPATPAAAPAAPSAPSFPKLPDGLIDRTGSPGSAAAPATAATAATPATPGATPATGKAGALDWTQLLNDIKGKVRPNTYFGISNMLLKNQESLATLDQKRQETATSAAKLQDDENDQFAQMARHVQQSGYSRPVLLTALAMMKATPSYSAHADQIAQAIAADPDNAKSIIDAVASHTTAPMLTAQARQTTAATTQEKQANEAPKQQADAQQAQMAATAQKLLTAETPEDYGALRAGLDPDLKALFPAKFDPAAIRRIALTPEQQTNADISTTREQNTAANDAAMRQQGNARLGLEAQGLAIRKIEADPFGQLGLNPHPPLSAQPGPDGQPLKGEAFLNTLPTSMRARVKAIAEGRDTSIPRGAAQGPLMAAVNQYDPTYTAARAKMRSAFTTGKQGDNIGALNTATVHLDQLADAADALKNHSFRPGNQAYNSLSAAFGQDAVTNFDALKTAVAGEMATALKGNATDQEIHHITDTLVSSNSPAQLAGVARTNLHVLGAKLNTYDERYKSLNPDDPNFSPVGPAARAVFQKNAIRPLASDAAPKKNPYR